jgi:hypothetical protein
MSTFGLALGIFLGILALIIGILGLDQLCWQNTFQIYEYHFGYPPVNFGSGFYMWLVLRKNGLI